MDPVSHFEVPYEEKERMEKFYGNVFGWQFFPAPGENPYSFAITSEVDDEFLPKERGRINGGAYQRGGEEYPSAKGPVIVIEVASCSQKIETVLEHGGEVVVPAVPVGDMGIYAQVRDSEGNIIGLWEPVKREECDS